MKKTKSSKAYKKSSTAAVKKAAVEDFKPKTLWDMRGCLPYKGKPKPIELLSFPSAPNRKKKK